MKPIKIYHNLQFDYFNNIAISIGGFQTRERKHLAAQRYTKVEKFSYTADARVPFKLRETLIRVKRHYIKQCNEVPLSGVLFLLFQACKAIYYT